jgi:hypothetical protein
MRSSSRSRCTKAAVHSVAAERVLGPKKPMVGSLLGCCARVASGQAAAAPPSSVMNCAANAIRTSDDANCRCRAEVTLRASWCGPGGPRGPLRPDNWARRASFASRPSRTLWLGVRRRQ